MTRANRRPHLWSLELACACFALLGVLVAVAGTSAGFAPWNAAVSGAFFGAADYGDALPMVQTTLGIVGGSIVGKWIAALWLVAVPLRSGRRWAWEALWAGLLGWFAIDSAVSIATGAAFNVWMINAAPLVVFGALLSRQRPRPGAGKPPRIDVAWRALFWVCIAFVGVGVAVAVALSSPLFSIYTDQFAKTFFGGKMPPSAYAYLAFIAGPIGGTFAAHFVMLAWAIRCTPAADRSWLRACIVTSVLGWFIVDSTMCLWHGAWFNVAMINVPTLVAVGLPLWRVGGR